MPRKTSKRDSREDARLVRSYRQGDGEAFAALLERYEDPVYNITYRMVGDREEARDLAQEAFVRAYERIDSFDPSLPFSAWIYRIATNAAIDHLRRRKGGQVSIDTAFDDGQPSALDRAAARAAPDAGLPESVTISNEVSRVVRGAVLLLPENYRAVVVLHHLEELSYSEVGRVMGIPKNTAKTWARRARAILCESLEGVI